MAARNFLHWLMVAMTVWTSSVVFGAIKLRHLSSVYLPYNTSSAGPMYNLSSDAVEQVAYDPQEKIIYAGGFGVLHVIDGSNFSKLTLMYSKFVEGLDFTDVEVCDNFVFASADNENNKLEGQLQVYKKHKREGNVSIELIRSVIVGPVPDNIYLRPGCKNVLIALEGEAFNGPDGQFIDPEGAVIIVDWPQGPQSPTQTVKTLDFKNFNNKVDELTKKGVRYVFRENNTFSADLEPEFIAFDADSNKAYVTLQENNAVAEVDLSTETVTRIHGLGSKQWGYFDASDRDKGPQISYWPIKALYQPDAIQFVSWKGRKLVLTANEGDQKNFKGFKESQRGKQFKDLGDNIPPIVKLWLSDDEQLGRLKISKLDGLDQNGVYQDLYTYGGRSFSIWDAADNNLRLVYDSDSDIEKITALRCPHAFNTEGEDVDEKSDSKGPETESLAVGQLGDRLVIFVGNENPGTILVYSIGDDVTKPRFEDIFCDGLPDNAKTLQEKFDAREVFALDPEDMKFVSATDSSSGFPVLIVAGSVSGTISVLKVDVIEEQAGSSKNGTSVP